MGKHWRASDYRALVVGTGMGEQNMVRPETSIRHGVEILTAVWIFMIGVREKGLRSWRHLLRLGLRAG